MEHSISQAVAVLEMRADALSQSGNFNDAGVMLMARQVIRVLWTQMNPPKQQETESKDNVVAIRDASL